MRWLLKRWWFWGGTGFMLVAVVAGYLLIPVGKGQISQTNCDRIQPGWTLEQVQDLLGNSCSQGWLGAHWIDEDDNCIAVLFHADGRVRTSYFVPSTIPAHERMKRRIERRFRALWP